jgi:hypothetical protein
LLWTIFVILLVLWLPGLIGGVGGQLIHLLIMAAGAVVIYNLSRRAAFQHTRIFSRRDPYLRSKTSPRSDLLKRFPIP